MKLHHSHNAGYVQLEISITTPRWKLKPLSLKRFIGRPKRYKIIFQKWKYFMTVQYRHWFEISIWREGPSGIYKSEILWPKETLQ